MAKLEWDQAGQRLYETGTKMGVVYPYDKEGKVSTLPEGLDSAITESKSKYAKGVAWNGLTAVSESPSGADATDLWADDMKYLSLRAAETFGATIEAYTYPDEFAVLDGSVNVTKAKGVIIGQQSRGSFAFCYRSTVGNDTELNDFGYKLHLIYGCTASPSERSYATINDSPEAITFSWELQTTPVTFEYNSVTYSAANLTIDTTKLDDQGKKNLAKLEECLYGSETTEAFMPMPDEVAKIMDMTASA